jgi:DNA-binding NtrC family response regulator
MNSRILLIEDDDDARELLEELLTNMDMEVVTGADFSSAERLLSTESFDTVLTDLQLRGRGGLDVCDAVQRLQPGVPVIVVTGHGSLSSAIEAMRAGAYDFITKPVDAQLLGLSLHRALEHWSIQGKLKQLEDTVEKSKRPGRLIGECSPMKRVYDLIARVSDTPASVLVCGESGTGKELVAQALHQGGSRRDKPFVAINCAAVPATLLESELFGHEKGAFTDARNARAGLFREAEGGTVFLDEIGEMPAEMQAKLLRVLQERKVRPVGGSREHAIDVRLVAATHRDLEEEIEHGRFREDLYYRLNVVQVNLPPLRSRGNDVLLLAQEFVRESAIRLGRDVTGLSSEAAEKLLGFDWPGNVRQLQNCIERAVTLARFDQIAPDDLPERVRSHESAVPEVGHLLDPEHVQPLEVVERRYIEQVLKIAGDNKSQAARLLGMDRRTLYRKLEQYAEADLEGKSRQAEAVIEAPN